MARRLAPPAAGSDAELLDLYRLGRDEAAFAALVRRHAPAVRAVARARLANAADADDVCQATFFVLARDAHRVRESVAGWLVRVAHLTALQHRRNLARRRTGSLPDELPGVDDPVAAAAARETAATVAEELARLPDKLRAVLALCALDGLTAAVAAERLGVPKGTVDTRLATAKRRLAARLARRGLAAGSLAAVAVAPVSAEFADGLARAAWVYALAPVAPTPVSLLADGVRPAMTSTARLFALGMVAAAATGTAGTALYHGRPADDKPQAKAPPPAKPADPPKPAPEPDAAAPAPLATEVEARAALARPVPEDVSAMTVADLFEWLYAKYGLIVRIDVATCDRLMPFPEDATATLYDRKLRTRMTRGMSVADLLAEVAVLYSQSDASRRYAFRVRGGQALMVPAYATPTLLGGGNLPGSSPVVAYEQMIEQVVGPPVSVALDELSLTAAVKRLRELTGANVVIDARAREKSTERVVGTFDDVRLLTVLQVLADQAGLKVVTLNNVYYLTDSANAVALQKQADRDLHGAVPSVGGSPAVTIPAGFVTDGYQYFPRTADMKPVDPRAVGALGRAGGGAGFGGGTGPAILPLPGTQPVPAPAAEKK